MVCGQALEGRVMAVGRNLWLAIAALGTGIVLCAPAYAQQMYRCGKQYQDRPCDDAKQGKVIGSTGSPQSSGPAVDEPGRSAA